jgi:hypothetical protein
LSASISEFDTRKAKLLGVENHLYYIFETNEDIENSMNIRNIRIWMQLFVIVVMVLASAWSSVDSLQEIQTKFDNYKKRNVPVKIDFVFNQPIYAPGDTAFFSAWYHDEEFAPVKGDQIITIELYAGNDNLAQRMYFKVRNGRGSNQIIFDQKLPAGEYQLVAYSDWMKNFGDAWFYRKNVTLVSEKYSGRGKAFDAPITFYPEGGNLIEGKLNRVVLLGPASTELTIRSTESLVTKVLTDSAGMGVFEITPKLNQHYYTESSSGKKYEINQISTSGLGIRLSTEGTSIDIIKAPNFVSDKEDLYAVMTSRGKIVLKQKIELVNDSNRTIQIPKEIKSSALHQFFILNAKGKVLAQRLFFSAQRSEIIAKVETKSGLYQREEVPYQISLFDTNGNMLDSDVVVSIVQDSLFKEGSVLNDFNLSVLPKVSEHYKSLGRNYRSSINDFLITQEWKRIDWESILTEKMPELKFPFTSTLTLRGKLISKESGSNAPDSTLVIGYLQKNVAGYEAYTKNGYFEIPFVYDFFGHDEIFCTAQFKSKNIDDKYTISAVTDSEKIADLNLPVESSTPSAYGKYVKAKRLVTNSFSFFAVDQSKRLNADQNRNALFEEEFLGADYSVTLADYVVFSTMKDVIHEIIPFVQYRNRGDQETIRMIFKYNEKTKTYKDDPLYLVDGVMTRNTAFFLAIKPEDVISVKIINNPNKLDQLGKLGENGIILVETKNDNLLNALRKENHFPVVGLNFPITFSPLEDPKLPSRYPDLRPTLYWNPQLILKSTDQTKNVFYTSDDVGKMRICIQGLTKDGQYFFFEQLINVGFNRTRN